MSFALVDTFVWHDASIFRTPNSKTGSWYLTSEIPLQGSTAVLKMLASCRSKLSARANDIAHYTTLKPFRADVEMSQEVWRLPEEDLQALLKQNFTSSFRSGYVLARGCTMPEYFLKFADRIRELTVKEDDVFVCSFPKCGTTWAQEMVWCIANGLDFEKAKSQALQERFPFLEHSPLFDYRDLLRTRQDITFPDFVIDSVGHVASLSGPRFIKTHLPLKLLPKNLQDETRKAKFAMSSTSDMFRSARNQHLQDGGSALERYLTIRMPNTNYHNHHRPEGARVVLSEICRKWRQDTTVVYVSRDPRDCCVSYFHHCRLLEGYTGDFQSFLQLFLNGRVCFGPFWDHVLEFWNIRDQPNILFITYEDMKEDLGSVVRQVAQFLGKTLTDQQVEALKDHLSFESMRNNKAVNYESVTEINRKYGLIREEGSFMRSGKSGEFLKAMTNEQIELFNEWSRKHLDRSGYKIPQ